jgi:hypothetical protein
VQVNWKGLEVKRLGRLKLRKNVSNEPNRTRDVWCRQPVGLMRLLFKVDGQMVDNAIKRWVFQKVISSVLARSNQAS